MSAGREEIYKGLSYAAWGYFFLNFDLNFGTVSVIPRFIGFLMLAAVSRLSGEHRDLALLRPLAILLSVWTALDWVASWFGQDLDGRILSLDLFITTVQLYFHFQFLTDMAALAEQYQPEGDNLDQRLRRRRTVYVVLITAIALVQALPAELNGRWREWLVAGGAVIAIISALLIMTALFSLRRCFRESEAAPEQ